MATTPITKKKKKGFKKDDNVVCPSFYMNNLGVCCGTVEGTGIVNGIKEVLIKTKGGNKWPMRFPEEYVLRNDKELKNYYKLQKTIDELDEEKLRSLMVIAQASRAHIRGTLDLYADDTPPILVPYSPVRPLLTGSSIDNPKTFRVASQFGEQPRFDEDESDSELIIDENYVASVYEGTHVQVEDPDSEHQNVPETQEESRNATDEVNSQNLEDRDSDHENVSETQEESTDATDDANSQNLEDLEFGEDQNHQIHVESEAETDVQNTDRNLHYASEAGSDSGSIELFDPNNNFERNAGEPTGFDMERYDVAVHPVVLRNIQVSSILRISIELLATINTYWCVGPLCDYELFVREREEWTESLKFAVTKSTFGVIMFFTTTDFNIKNEAIGREVRKRTRRNINGMDVDCCYLCLSESGHSRVFHCNSTFRKHQGSHSLQVGYWDCGECHQEFVKKESYVVHSFEKSVPCGPAHARWRNNPKHVEMIKERTSTLQSNLNSMLRDPQYQSWLVSLPKCERMTRLEMKEEKYEFSGDEMNSEDDSTPDYDVPIPYKSIDWSVYDFHVRDRDSSVSSSESYNSTDPDTLKVDKEDFGSLTRNYHYNSEQLKPKRIPGVVGPDPIDTSKFMIEDLPIPPQKYEIGDESEAELPKDMDDSTASQLRKPKPRPRNRDKVASKPIQLGKRGKLGVKYSKIREVSYDTSSNSDEDSSDEDFIETRRSRFDAKILRSSGATSSRNSSMQASTLSQSTTSKNTTSQSTTTSETSSEGNKTISSGESASMLKEGKFLSAKSKKAKEQIPHPPKKPKLDIPKPAKKAKVQLPNPIVSEHTRRVVDKFFEENPNKLNPI